MHDKRLYPHALRDDELLFFLHIPKTGGTSLRAIIEPRFDSLQIYPAKDMPELATAPKPSAQYRLVCGHFPYDFSLRFGASPVYIVMLRDPIKRAISYYKYVRRQKVHPLNRAAHALSLVDFVARYRNNINNQSILLHGTYDAQNNRVIPHPDPDEGLQIAKQRLNTMHVVGIVEHFRASLDLMAYTLAWSFTADIPHLNRDPRQTRRDDYPAETINALSELCQHDRQLYDYALDMFYERQNRMMQTILEQNYEWHAPALQYPQKQVQVTMDAGMNGTGWHRIEHSKTGDAYRWTNARTDATLDVSLVGGYAYDITIHVGMVLVDEMWDTWQLRVGEYTVRLQRSRHPRLGWVHRGTIPAQIIDDGRRFTRLQFIVDGEQSPADIKANSRDTRPLGIAVISVDLKAQDA